MEYEFKPSIDTKEELSRAIEGKKALIALQSDKGYILLNTLVQEQVDELQRSILFDPCSGIDSAWSQEYKKGQLEGKLSWGQVLITAISSFEVTINQLKDELDADSTDGSANGHSAP